MKPLPFNSEQLAPLVKEMLERMQNPAYQDLVAATAIERRIKYKAYLKEGFTEQQALELCTK